MIVIPLITALLLTIIIECGVTLLFGYRKKEIFKSVILVNVITNVSLNLVLLANRYFTIINPETFLIIFLEIVVVFVEWRLLSLALVESNKKLFFLSFIMNCSSFLIGLLIFS